MPSVRLGSLWRQAVLHVCRNRIPGAIVECGVWKGGSMMAAANTLMECGERRPLYLCDTFARDAAAGRSPAVFLNRVDYTCRLVVKPAS